MNTYAAKKHVMSLKAGNTPKMIGGWIGWYTDHGIPMTLIKKAKLKVK